MAFCGRYGNQQWPHLWDMTMSDLRAASEAIGQLLEDEANAAKRESEEF